MARPVRAGKPGIRACTGVGTRRRGTTVRDCPGTLLQLFGKQMTTV